MTPGRITLRQLDCLRAVVETGSISDAADQLHVSPAGVSQAITQLEEQLDVQLTLRTRGRGVEITAAGEAVYARARDVSAGIDEIRDVAATMRGELVGPLRIGLFTTLSPWLFPRIAEHFSHRFPSVDLQLEEAGSRVLQDGLLEGRLDAALVYENHILPGIEGHAVAPVRLQIALAPDHPLARLDAVPLKALKDEQAVLLAMRPASDHVEQFLQEAGLTPKVRWRSANVETLRSLVARGLAYMIIMGRPHGDVTYEGLPIVYRPIADDLPPNSVALAFARGARPTAKARELLSFCVRTFGHDGALEPGLLSSRMGQLS